jgi:hypothetical protein
VVAELAAFYASQARLVRLFRSTAACSGRGGKLPANKLFSWWRPLFHFQSFDALPRHAADTERSAERP